MNLKDKISRFHDRAGRKTDYDPIMLFAAVVLVRTFFTRKIFTSTGITGADEIGTIASAAYFAGYDWSGILSDTLYYGFGYSMFLAPVFILFKNPATIHHLLLFSNNILIALCGVIAYRILIRFFRMKKRSMALLVSGTIVLYLPLSFYSNLLINESMLSLLVWTVLYLLLLLNEEEEGKRKNIHSVLLGVVLGYSLMVHSRSMVLIAASVCTVLAVYMITKRKMVNPAFFFPVLIFGGCISQLSVKAIQRKLWLAQNGKELVNSTEDVVVRLVDNLKLLFSFQGWKLYGSEILGQVYTMAVFTYGIFMVACVEIFLFFRIFWRKKQRGRDSKADIGKLAAILFGSFGLVMTLASSALVSLQRVEEENADGIASKMFLFSRYWSIYMLVFLLLGGYFLYKYQRIAKKIITAAFFGILSVFFLFHGYLGFRYDGRENFSTGVFYPFLAIGFWRPEDLITGTSFFKLTLLVLAVFSAAMFLVLRKKIRAAYMVVCLLMFVNYVYGTYHISYRISDKLYSQFGEMITVVDDSGYESERIYTNGKYAPFKLWLQYLLPRYKVTYGIEEGEENAIAITDSVQDEFFSGGWYTAYHNKGELLYEDMYVFVKGEELAENLTAKGHEIKKADLLELTGYYLKPSYEQEEREILGGIVNGSVEQSFTITQEMEHKDFQIEIQMATYMRTNEGTLRFEVIQGDHIFVCDINKNQMLDNDWQMIEVRDRAFKKGGAVLRITDLNHDIENCVTAYLIDTQQPGLGDLYFEDVKNDRKLCMRIKSYEEGF